MEAGEIDIGWEGPKVYSFHGALASFFLLLAFSAFIDHAVFFYYDPGPLASRAAKEAHAGARMVGTGFVLFWVLWQATYVKIVLAYLRPRWADASLWLPTSGSAAVKLGVAAGFALLLAWDIREQSMPQSILGLAITAVFWAISWLIAQRLAPATGWTPARKSPWFFAGWLLAALAVMGLSAFGEAHVLYTLGVLSGTIATSYAALLLIQPD